MILSLLLSGIASFLIPIAQGATLTSALLLILPQILGDGPATIYHINQVSLRQTITPDRLLGRMNASMRFIVWGTIPIGALTNRDL